MLSHWHRAHFALPLMLSLLEWSAFSLYWSSAAKKASPSITSEPIGSRRLHVILLNIAFLLLVVPSWELGQKSPLRAAWIAWVGAAVQSMSLALAVLARRQLAFQWSGEITIKVDHVLVQSGPYRWIRHPIYTAILGMFLGSVLVSGRVLALFGLVVAWFAYMRKIKLEESNLRHAFGAAYKVYCRKTGALIPKAAQFLAEVVEGT